MGVNHFDFGGRLGRAQNVLGDTMVDCRVRLFDVVNIQGFIVRGKVDAVCIFQRVFVLRPEKVRFRIAFGIAQQSNTRSGLDFLVDRRDGDEWDWKRNNRIKWVMKQCLWQENADSISCSKKFEYRLKSLNGDERHGWGEFISCVTFGTFFWLLYVWLVFRLRKILRKSIFPTVPTHLMHSPQTETVERHLLNVAGLKEHCF